MSVIRTEAADAFICLPLCARSWLSNANRTSDAARLSPLLMKISATESSLVSALAIPALSMSPVRRNSAITLAMPAAVAFTTTVAGIECVSGGEVPVTVGEYEPAVTVGARLILSVEEAAPLTGGVTEFGLNDPVTPLGDEEMVSATAELK